MFVFVLAHRQDLAKTMCPSGTVEGGQGKVGESWQYMQILIVIQEEVEDYKKYGPKDVFIFALPEEASKRGICFSRHFAKKLAEQICPHTLRFCLMMDDSVQYWKGITLQKDPLKPFCKAALIGADAKAVRADISLADVLLHFISGLRDDKLKVKDFAIIGFHRLNGWESSQRAFKRTHCTSTVILNLEKLKDVHYLKRAWVWEDLQFNRDVEEKGLVICKCYQFAFYTPQLKEGGCADMVARAANNEMLDDENRNLTNEAIEDLQNVLRGLIIPGRKGGDKLCDEELNGYVKTLDEAWISLHTLKETFLSPHQNGNGKNDVIQALEKAGVKPHGMVQAFANAISKLVK